MTRPEVSLPKLDPNVDVVTYHAKTSARVFGVVSCERTDLYQTIQQVCQLVSKVTRVPTDRQQFRAALTLRYFGRVQSLLLSRL